MRHGGPPRCAAELGVPLIRRQPGPQLNTSETRECLRALLRREQRPRRFPSERWLREHGAPRTRRPPSSAAVGAQLWARELGVPGPRPARWTDDLIGRELRLLCAEKTHWPTKHEFVQAGLTGLLRAIHHGYGSQW